MLYVILKRLIRVIYEVTLSAKSEGTRCANVVLRRIAILYLTMKRRSQPAFALNLASPSGRLAWSLFASIITIFRVTRCFASRSCRIHSTTRSSMALCGGFLPPPSILLLLLGAARILSSFDNHSHTRLRSTPNFLAAAIRVVALASLIT